MPCLASPRAPTINSHLGTRGTILPPLTSRCSERIRASLPLARMSWRRGGRLIDWRNCLCHEPGLRRRGSNALSTLSPVKRDGSPQAIVRCRVVCVPRHAFPRANSGAGGCVYPFGRVRPLCATSVGLFDLSKSRSSGGRLLNVLPERVKSLSAQIHMPDTGA